MLMLVFTYMLFVICGFSIYLIDYVNKIESDICDLKVNVRFCDECVKIGAVFTKKNNVGELKSW